MRRAVVLALTLAASACGDSSPTSTGPDAPAVPDSHLAIDAAPGTGPDAAPATADAAPLTADAPALPDAGATFTLTIHNYLGWCDITANGGPFTVNNVPMTIASKAFAQGSIVALHGAPNGDFVWGYWTGTDHVVDGKDTNQSTTVTLDGDKTIMVCCPVSGTTCPASF